MNMSVKYIAGDGNCLFRALAYFIKSNVEKYDELKREVISYITDNWDTFSDAVSREHGTQSSEEYAQYMKRDGTYGSEAEISAAANLYNTCVSVYFSNVNTKAFRICGKDANDDFIRLLYTGDGRNGHYSAIDTVNSCNRTNRSSPMFVIVLMILVVLLFSILQKL